VRGRYFKSGGGYGFPGGGSPQEWAADGGPLGPPVQDGVPVRADNFWSGYLTLPRLRGGG